MSQHGFRPKSVKTSTKHPIACIEKRVIDSEAFAALPPSAVVVLLLMARNLDKGCNGHVFIATNDAQRHGINEKTLYRQIKTLIAHGFICQTKRGGNGVCAKYGLTWLPLSKDTKGIQVDHFQPAAWRNWTPVQRKNATVKMSASTGQKYRFAPELADKNTVSLPDKNTDIEFNTNTDYRSCTIPSETAGPETRGADRLKDYLSKLAEARMGNGPHANRVMSHLTLIECRRAA